eukprot:CAMPEP_0183328112 /NCGR_PEP_ID=MMETSP0160_2-20130417/84114_1 /TAXON_ID=2839 ORGANISM="Odontella Sinensis, Strain Grunow 1884" /NCGR_SAMPLE_ID=MMETSP0160_2 /ASSEMBLY_ACC=CAM_ASM_000250 /LENGTH=290 /DNA_ID=CAMNT_0025496271 /DNA_START=113 /DNA_END=985 /DNA_ORIENTATION=+
MCEAATATPAGAAPRRHRRSAKTKAAFLVAAAASLPAASAFGVSPGRASAAVSASAPRLPPPAHAVPSAASASPLFATTESDFTADALTDGDKKALQSIEKEIDAFNRKRAKALEKLSQVEKGLQVLEQKKTSYLEGLKLGKQPEGGNFSETTLRSAVKSMMWRVIAGTVTLITSLRFSGSLATALGIVGGDFFSKALTMFMGERLMNKSKAGRTTGSDGVGRSLAKALIWRLFAICNTLTMSLVVAKDLSIASKIAGSDAVFKTALMFFYERAWAEVVWGKEYEIKSSI